MIPHISNISQQVYIVIGCVCVCVCVCVCHRAVNSLTCMSQNGGLGRQSSLRIIIISWYIWSTVSDKAASRQPPLFSEVQISVLAVILTAGDSDLGAWQLYIRRWRNVTCLRRLRELLLLLWWWCKCVSVFLCRCVSVWWTVEVRKLYTVFMLYCAAVWIRINEAVKCTSKTLVHYSTVKLVNVVKSYLMIWVYYYNHILRKR